MDRKGHIPTYLLLLVCLALCITALFAFAGVNKKFDANSAHFSDLSNELVIGHQYVINAATLAAQDVIESGDSDIRTGFQEKIAVRDVRLDSAGNFFGKVRSGEFRFEENSSGYVLNVENVFVQSQNGESRIKRTFNLRIDFDNFGNVVRTSAQGL